MQLLSLQSLSQPAGGAAPASVDPNASGGSGTVVGPDGDTAFPYTSYDMPYSGVPGNLVTRWGVTLQPGPMRSLLRIARGSDLMPGARELRMITDSYRSYAAQAAAAAAKPGIAAPAGHSYHGQGLAIDAGWWTDHGLGSLLRAAGWNQFDAGREPWHYSYGAVG